MIKALLLDRDGVVNVDVGYNSNPQKLIWTTGFLELSRLCNLHKVKIFIITNQSGIARGYFSLNDVNKLHKWMNKEINNVGGIINGFYVCPHYKKGNVIPYSIDCNCRKPKPMLIKNCMRDNNLNKDDVVMIGDKLTDVEAGQRSGIHSLLFNEENLLNWISKQNILNWLR